MSPQWQPAMAESDQRITTIVGRKRLPPRVLHNSAKDAPPTMIDLHCHLLPGIDDGAAELSVSLEMARAFVADGVSVVACTPHILPGLYHNSGPQIRQATPTATADLRQGR